MYRNFYWTVQRCFFAFILNITKIWPQCSIYSINVSVAFLSIVFWNWNRRNNHFTQWIWKYFLFQFSVQLLVTMLTIFGNLTIIVCVSRHKNLQRPSHFFIASLATTDLFLGLTVMVPRLTDEVFGGWYFGYFMCQVMHKICFLILNLNITIRRITYSSFCNRFFIFL